MQTNYLPSVSVIIPFYGSSQDVLWKCIYALGKQSYPSDRFEVIVIDNNPTPSLKSGSYGRLFVRVLYEPMIGSYSARNRGIDNANGDILAFTDSDCIPDMNWLKNGVGELVALKHNSGIGGKIIFTFKRQNQPNIFEIYDSNIHLRQEYYVNQLGFAATANFIVAKEMFKIYGKFDSKYYSGGDREWGEISSRKGIKIYFSEDVIIYHPARARLCDLIEKNIRAVGGEFVRFDNNPNRAGHLLISQVLALRERRGNLKNKYQDLLLLKLYTIIYIIYFIRIVEALRLLLGGTIRRK